MTALPSSPAASGQLSSRVLAQSSKFTMPGVAGPMLHRPGIDERMERAPSARLILVRAPAGFGKSMTLRQLRSRLDADSVATAWLTLDAADNDVPRFLDCLAEAVARLQVHDATHPGAPLDVLGTLAREGPPFALFLDEFEVIQAPAVLGVVREIIGNLPRGGRLVIGSRSLPDLGLGRLRVRAQLLELDTDLLRFSLAETADYLRLRGSAALTPEQLVRLHGKTEGWIAALWLASMALERHPDTDGFMDRFSGSSQGIADYLAEEVLANQPADVRDFLLRTSVLRQLSASLCKNLVPRVDCARMLERLNAASLFLTPIDADAAGEERSYRYHSLFAHFLRTQLARERPDEMLRLHLAASGWYESIGRPVPAIDHAIEGGDFPHAVNLLSQHAQLFLEQGRMRLLARWFAVLPPEILAARPLLQMVSVWAVCFTQGPWEAMSLLAATHCAESADATLQAHVNALRPLLLAMMDRYDEAHAIGRESLARLPSALPFADSALSNAMAHVMAVLGESHEAHRLLDAARRTQNASVFNRMYTESTEGLLDLEQARLRQATARFRVAVSATARGGDYGHTSGNAWAGVLYAGVVYEAHQPEAAERLLNVYLPLARDVGLPDHMITSHAMRARLNFLRGDIDSASRVLTELEALGHHRQLPRVVASAKLERARMLLLQRSAQASRAELDRAGDDALWARVARQHLPAHDVDDMAIARVRWDIHFGSCAAALERLEALLQEAHASLRLHRALKLRVLQSIAQWRSGARDAGTATMQAVLADASREGFVRLLLDEGPLVAGPICRVAALQAGDHRGDPFLVEHVQRLVELLGPAAQLEDDDGAAPAPATGAEAMPWQDPLTPKEIRVLKLLAEGYSNSAMSEKLFVSDSTVRTHLRNINMKLAAQNRTQAVSLARRYGLIR
jgi:LuxR family maltose regulon positive regulatory protein